MEADKLPNWRYQAEGWAANGFDPYMARRWRMAGFRAWEARYWHMEGFYPDEAWSAREAGLDWEMAAQLSGKGCGSEETGYAPPSITGGPTNVGRITTGAGGSAPLQASYAGGNSGAALPNGTTRRASRKVAFTILAAAIIMTGGLALVGIALQQGPFASHAVSGSRNAKAPADMISSRNGIAQVMLDINPPPLYGKPAPSGGILQDAYVPARFTVKSGEHVDVTVTNFSTDTHTFTSSQLRLNVIIHPGSHLNPHATTFQFVAPKAGTYYWHCTMPCGWGMHHLGYMMGEVVVIA
ncbi:MAG: cupredoxin domain-containing protein [Acidimicrobiales bacterium]